MNPETQRNRILGQLAAAFWDTGYEKESKTLESYEDRGLEDVVSLLSSLERLPGLPTDLWELVVRAKGVLLGKVDFDQFFEQSMRYLGLL